MIYGICGFAGSGKDTIANILIDQYGFTKLAFADHIKDVLSVLFGWDRRLLEGVTNESRLWRETADPYWSKKLEIVDFTPRKAMTMLGTDIMRKNFHNKLWIYSLENKMKTLISNGTNIVIPDCRYQNEMEMIRENGGLILRVDRKPYPDFYDIAIKAVVNKDSEAQRYLDENNIHDSEYSWLSEPGDYQIDNNTNVESLECQIQLILA